MLKQFQKLQLEAKIDFLRSVPLLQSFPSTIAEKLAATEMKVVTFNSKGQYVFKEGEESNYIAIVKDGEFEVVKQDLSSMDPNLFTFLKLTDVLEETAKEIRLRRGSKSVFKKSTTLFPASKHDSITQKALGILQSNSNKDA